MIDVHCVTFDCAQPYELATFWRDATGGELHPDTEKNDDEVLLQGGRVDLLFIRVPEDKAVKNRVPPGHHRLGGHHPRRGGRTPSRPRRHDLPGTTATPTAAAGSRCSIPRATSSVSGRAEYERV
ncbi:VOC family protein [Streptosporangium vulgare]|uniref:VOC family protein n=1 Tax=Streptosporangium vulgare TaxID=46190 RepID=UPI0031E1DA9C